MNYIVTHLAEKIIELGYLVRTFRSPNPFRPVNQTDPWWQTSSLEAFYAIPEEPPDLVYTPLAEAKGEKLARFHYPSPYISPHLNNNTVYGLADLRPEGDSKAALIFLHGHMMTRATMFPLMWHSRQAIREGFDLYYMNLPYHMLRKPPKSYGGQYSLNSNIERSALAFMQGVRDVRVLINWIAREKRMPVALAGVSLGAFTACMTAVVDARPRAVISLLGGASLARILWDGYHGGKTRNQLICGGISFDQLEQFWKLINPANYQPKLDREQVLMIAGQYDEIVTPENVTILWESWNRPKLCWYPCGHVTSAIYHRSIASDISSFLNHRLDYT